MAIVDVTIIPIGTESPSVSAYVADIQKVLKEYKDAGKIDYQLTPMNTLIEGELPVLFEVVQAMHEDDRRDVKRQMADKVKRVESLLQEDE